MKSANVDNTIKFIDKKTEYEGKNKRSKLDTSKLSKENKVIRYKEHKKLKAHKIKKQKILNSNIYKFKKIIIGIIISILILIGLSGIYL